MSATVMPGRTSAESITSSASLTRSRASSVDHLVETVGATGRSAGGKSRALSVRSLSSRSEEHTSELQSLMRISYAVFCLKKKKKNNITSKTVTGQNRNQ